VSSSVVGIGGFFLVLKRPEPEATFPYTVQLCLSGLIWTTSHPDIQKIRIIGSFFENGLHWQFEVGKKNSEKRLF
jgi:hypothetical protein